MGKAGRGRKAASGRGERGRAAGGKGRARRPRRRRGFPASLASVRPALARPLRVPAARLARRSPPALAAPPPALGAGVPLAPCLRRLRLLPHKYQLLSPSPRSRRRGRRHTPLGLGLARLPRGPRPAPPRRHSPARPPAPPCSPIARPGSRPWPRPLARTPPGLGPVRQGAGRASRALAGLRRVTSARRRYLPPLPLRVARLPALRGAPATEPAPRGPGRPRERESPPPPPSLGSR